MRACSKCGSDNTEDQNFCVSCGSKLPLSLALFLSEAGLAAHLDTFKSNDLLTVDDLLALGDADLRELQLPYGDVLRLRSALNAHRGDNISEERVAQEQPALIVPETPQYLPAQTTAAPPVASVPSSTGTGKIVGGVLAGVAALLVLAVVLGGDPNKQNRAEDPAPAAPPSNVSADELDRLREKAHLAEKERAEAQRQAAEREAESLRRAAERAEQEKEQALQRAALAEQQAAAQISAQQQAAPALNGLDDFLHSYLNSLASNNQWDTASHYADTVRYGYAKSSSGLASRGEVAEDIRKLIASYPARSYSNISVREIVPEGQGSARINYGFDYQYNGKKLARGSTDVWATVELIGGRWQITSWRESVRRIR
jgi:hypothetical protein